MTHQDFTALAGAWRLMSFGITFSDTGERIKPYGANPDGHIEHHDRRDDSNHDL